MEQFEGKLSAVPKATPNQKADELRDLSGSHQMTLNRPLPVTGEKVETFSNNVIEYHLTIRIMNESLNRRQLSLLLEVLCYQSINFGVNLPMYLAISELYFRLLGNKFTSKEMRDSKIRLVCTISEILLKTLKGTDLPLDPKEYVTFGAEARQLLSPYLMSKRTFGSRYRTWRPEKFFTVSIVPVDIQFLQRRKGSIPYSGYCKGYGESHPSAHSKKTKPSPELDGDGSNFVTADEEFLFVRCTEPTHLLSESLLIKYRNQFEE
jgi:hypothetical protein